MGDVREKAREFLSQIPPKVDVTSSGSTAALFTKLTGSSHEWLVERWAMEEAAREEKRAKGESTKGMPNTTTCNGLTGQLSAHIRTPITLGQFPLEKALKDAGLGEAWIPATSGKRPGFGDVFRSKEFHVGVSLDFEGDMWNTAESGQGGRNTGHDIVRRKQKPWDPSTLEGWVDIEILARISQKAPKWMIGWWKFEVGAAKEFVYLPQRGASRSFPTAPANLKIAPQAGGKSGEMAFDEDSEGISITWEGGVLDKLRHLPGVDYMLGTRGDPQLQAFKLK